MSAGPPFDAVAVETNWLLDIALHQDAGSEELLAQASRGIVAIYVPSICIAESIKRFEAMRRAWAELEREIKKTRRETERSRHLFCAEQRLVAATEALAEVSDVAEAEFWSVLENVMRVTKLIGPDVGIVGLTAEIRTFLKLEPVDASVLATVVAARRAGLIHKFVSRDNDFGAAEVLAYLGEEGVQFFDSAYPIVGPLRQHMASP